MSQIHLILRRKKSSVETAKNRASRGDFLRGFLRQSLQWGLIVNGKELGVDMKFAP